MFALRQAARLGRWQCASCREQFRDWDQGDYLAVVDHLREDERRLIMVGERLDGAGFWGAAAAVMRTAEKVNELARAIEEEHLR